MYRIAGELVQEISSGKFITEDPLSPDWRKLKAWEAEGNTPAPEHSLDEIRAMKNREVKDAGFARVHARFPPHRQRRLAFKAATNTEHKACITLIEAVKAAVDAAEAAILAAADEAAIDRAATDFGAALSVLKAI